MHDTTIIMIQYPDRCVLVRQPRYASFHYLRDVQPGSFILQGNVVLVELFQQLRWWGVIWIIYSQKIQIKLKPFYVRKNVIFRLKIMPNQWQNKE